MAAASKKVKLNSLIAEAESLARKRDFEQACRYYTEALEIEPSDKNLLLQRCRCFIALGVPERGVQDADAVLKLDKTHWRAALAKAQALYAGGNFEFALIAFHRGLKLRSDVDDFRLGIQKCKAAINDSIDQAALDRTFSEVKDASTVQLETSLDMLSNNAATSVARHNSTVTMQRSASTLAPSTPRAAHSSPSPQRSSPMFMPVQHGQSPAASPIPAGRDSASPAASSQGQQNRNVPRLDLADLQSQPPHTAQSMRVIRSVHQLDDDAQSDDSSPSNRETARSGSATQRRARSSRELLGALNADRKFLEELTKDSVLSRSVGKTQGPSVVTGIVADGLSFINKRREFWRQQMPPKESKPQDNRPLSSSRTARRSGSFSARSVSSSRVLSRKQVTAVDALESDRYDGTLDDEIFPHPPQSERPSHSQSARGAPSRSTHGASTSRPVAAKKTQATSQSSAAPKSHAVNAFALQPNKPEPASSTVVRVPPKKKHLQQTRYAIEMLEKINESIESGELETALKFSKAFLSKLATLDLADKPRILGNVYSLMGTTYLELNKLTLAAIHHRKDLDIAMRYSYTDSYHRALENLGVTYERMGDYAQAIRMWEKKLEDATEEEASRLWEDIGRCYYQLNDCETAISFAEKALDAAKRSGDKERMLSVQYTIGHTFCKIRQFPKAVPYFEAYLDLSKELGDVVAEANALTDLGNAYLEMGDVPKSITYQQQAMSLSARLNSR
jgi:tetratricopeptide (TPR) repeat protein